MVTKCDSCGAPVENGRCTYCGKMFTDHNAVPSQQAAPSEEKVSYSEPKLDKKALKKMTKCKSCGSMIAKSAKVCPSCGAKNKKPFYKKWWFWLLVILIIGGLGGQSNSDKDKTPSTVDSTIEESASVNANPTNNANTESTDITETPSQDTDSSTQSDEPVESAPAGNSTGLTAEERYQSILDEYSEKLKAATPGLIEEYKAEAANNTSGLEGLAQLSNEKIEELAAIANDGVAEMAKVMYKTGSGSYDEYEEWASKLYDVYMDEASKITDAYMDSAM